MSKILRDADGRYTSTATKRAEAWLEKTRVQVAEQKARDAKHARENKRWSDCEWYHEWRRKVSWPTDKLRNALRMAVVSGAITRAQRG